VKKRYIAFILAISALAFFSLQVKQRAQKLPHIGVVFYSSEDLYLDYVKSTFKKCAQGKADLDILYSKDQQLVQNEQIDTLLKDKVSVLMLNPVDRSAAGSTLEKAIKYHIPVVFFNKEPYAEDLKRYPSLAYYVGADARESGIIEGKIVADYWKAHPEADTNGDGILAYVMLRGQPGHQDTELRSQYSIQYLNDHGIPTKKIEDASANWQREEAQALMTSFINTNSDQIEVVIANNDEMALGAIEALKTNGYFREDKYMPVVGVDGTLPALRAIEDGTLLGTAKNDYREQGKAAFNLAYILSQGITPTEENIGFTIFDKQYVHIPYTQIDRSNFRIYLGEYASSN